VSASMMTAASELSKNSLIYDQPSIYLFCCKHYYLFACIRLCHWFKLLSIYSSNRKLKPLFYFYWMDFVRLIPVPFDRLHEEHARRGRCSMGRECRGKLHGRFVIFTFTVAF
jgi:hypothetical protein